MLINFLERVLGLNGEVSKTCTCEPRNKPVKMRSRVSCEDI
jgi:hypothetical protein